MKYFSIVRRLLLISFLILTILFGYLSYKRSQLPYNEIGRCFDPSGVVYEHDAYVGFIVITIFFALTFILSGFLMIYVIRGRFLFWCGMRSKVPGGQSPSR